MRTRNKYLVAAASVAGASAALFFLGLADYAFPGTSAHLIACAQGLVTEPVTPHPLMLFFVRIFGGNLPAPLAGVFATVGLFALLALFVRSRIDLPFQDPGLRDRAGLAAGLVAAFVFMSSAAVHAAATHLEPKMFDFAWMVAAFLLMIPWIRLRRGAWFFALAFGALWGLGLADDGIFLTALPLAVGGAWTVARRSRAHQKPVAALFLFLLGLAAAFFPFLGSQAGGVSDAFPQIWAQARTAFTANGWAYVAAFATLPFVTMLFSASRAYRDELKLSDWMFHTGMTLLAILAVATPLAPGAVCAKIGVLPVAATAFAAAVAGYAVSFWLVAAKTAEKRRPVAYVGGGLLVVLLAMSAVFDLATFDGKAGAFADRIADRVIDELGPRDWLAVNGLIDDHLRLAAAKRGREIHILCLQNESDDDYLAKVAAEAKASGVGGEANAELVHSLVLGVMPFLQDWFAADTNAVRSVAVFGSPEVWTSLGQTSHPGTLLFGTEPTPAPDEAEIAALDEILHAPEGWGSYPVRGDRPAPLDALRLRLRTHLGLVLNNRGFDELTAGRLDAAYGYCARVHEKIDRDNVCALFNLFEMTGRDCPAAKQHAAAYKRDLDKIVKDKNRRYWLIPLASIYGYIYNPDLFVSQGIDWARFGRPGEAALRLKRAIDFVPPERRAALLNMMAALYAEAGTGESEEIYRRVLAEDAENHDALIGMMNAALRDGDVERALGFLRRALKAAGDDPRVKIEIGMLAMFEGRLEEARKTFSAAAFENPRDMRAWSLWTSVLMQMSDREEDPVKRRKLEEEIEKMILPEMIKAAGTDLDYTVVTTRAFLFLRKGKAKQKEARDAFATMLKMRPDNADTQNTVLKLDIVLNDRRAADQHARIALRYNRKSALANYVMGSNALAQDLLSDAEMYLLKAANAPEPVLFALNDLAEIYRRDGRYADAERFARKAVKLDPSFATAWDTLATILLDAGGDLAEAEKAIEKAIELDRKSGAKGDFRLYMTQASVLMKSGKNQAARAALAKVKPHAKELTGYERKAYDALLKNVR